MQASETFKLFDRNFECDSPVETDFSPFFPSLAFSDSLAFSEFPDLTPSELGAWRSSNRDPDPIEDFGLMALDWVTWQLSLSPSVQAFLAGEMDAGLLYSVPPSPEFILEATEEATIDSASSSLDTLVSQSSSFDMTTLTSALSLTNYSMHSSSWSPSESPSGSPPDSPSDSPSDSISDPKFHSRFHSTFQSMMLEPESKHFPKSSWISQSTKSSIDFLFGSSAASNSETTNHARASLWGRATPHSKLWGHSVVSEETDSTHTPAWGFMDLASASSSDC